MIIPKTNIQLLRHVACTIGEVTNGKLDTRLSKLCTSNNINIWSKYKPVIHAFTTRPSDWWKGSNKDCGISIRQHSSAADLINSVVDGTAQYSHNKPANNYRLGDFAGYNPNAEPVLRDSPMSEILYQSTTNLIATAIYKDSSYSDWEIPPSDLFGSMASWYFGVGIKRGTTVDWMTSGTAGDMSVTVPVYANRGRIFATGTVQVVKFITQLKKTSFTGSTSGSSVFMALPEATVHTITIKSSTIVGSITAVKSGDTVTYTVTLKNTSGSSVKLTQLSVQITDATGNTAYYIDVMTPPTIAGNATVTYTGEYSNSSLPMIGKAILYVNNEIKDSTYYLVSSD